MTKQEKQLRQAHRYALYLTAATKAITRADFAPNGSDVSRDLNKGLSALRKASAIRAVLGVARVDPNFRYIRAQARWPRNLLKSAGLVDY